MIEVGPNLYRMEESSLLHEVLYHDIIEAERKDDGSLHLLQVAKASGLVTKSWILPMDFGEKPEVKVLLQRVMAIGGN